MQKKLINISQNAGARKSLFNKVFGSEEGKLLLEFLRLKSDYPADVNNVYNNYYQQGQIALIKDIEKTMVMKVKGDK